MALWVVHTDAWFWSWTGTTTLPPTVDNEGSGSQAGSGEPPSENIARTGLEIIDEGHGIQKVVQTETSQAPWLTTTTQPANEHASEKGAAGISSRKHKPGNATFSLKGTGSESSDHLRFTENESGSGSGLESELTSDTGSGLWFGSGSGSGSESGFGKGPENSWGTEESQQGEVTPTDLRGLEIGDSVVSQTNELNFKFHNSTITTHEETDEGYYLGSTKPEQNLAPNNNKENTKLNSSSSQNAFNLTKYTHEKSTPGDFQNQTEGNNNSVTKDNQVEKVNKLPTTESTAKQETLPNQMLWTTQVPFVIQTLSTTQTPTTTPKILFTPFETNSEKSDTTSIPTAAQSQLPTQASATSQTVVTTQVGHFLEATQTSLNEHEPSQASFISQAAVGDLAVGTSLLKDMDLGGSDHLKFTENMSGSGSGHESKLALDTRSGPWSGSGSGSKAQFGTKPEIRWGPEETQQGVIMPTNLSEEEATQLPARESSAKQEALPNQVLWTTQASSASQTLSTTHAPTTTPKMLFTQFQTASEKPDTTSILSTAQFQMPSQKSEISHKVVTNKIDHYLHVTQPSATEHDPTQETSISQTALSNLDVDTSLQKGRDSGEYNSLRLTGNVSGLGSGLESEMVPDTRSGPWFGSGTGTGTGSGSGSESEFGPKPEMSRGSQENQQGKVILTDFKGLNSGDSVVSPPNELNELNFRNKTWITSNKRDEGYYLDSKKSEQNFDSFIKTLNITRGNTNVDSSSRWNSNDTKLTKYSQENVTSGDSITPNVGDNSVTKGSRVDEVIRLPATESTAKEDTLLNQMLWTTQASFPSQTLSATQTPTTTPKMLFTPFPTASKKPGTTSIPIAVQSQLTNQASAISQKVVTTQVSHNLEATQPSISDQEPTQTTLVSQTDVSSLDIGMSLVKGTDSGESDDISFTGNISGSGSRLESELASDSGSVPWSGSGSGSESGFGREPENSWGYGENQQGEIMPTNLSLMEDAQVPARESTIKKEVLHNQVLLTTQASFASQTQSTTQTPTTTPKMLFTPLQAGSEKPETTSIPTQYSHENSTTGNVLTPVVGNSSVDTIQVTKDNLEVEVTQLPESASTAKQELLPNQVFQTTETSFSIQTNSIIQTPTTTPNMFFTPLQTVSEKPKTTSIPTAAQSQVPREASVTSQKVVTSQAGHSIGATEKSVIEHEPTQATLISQTDVGRLDVGTSLVMGTDSREPDHLRFTGNAWGHGSGLESELASDASSGLSSGSGSGFGKGPETSWGSEENQQRNVVPTDLSLVETAQLPVSESTVRQDASPNQWLHTTQGSFASQTLSTTQPPTTTPKMLFTQLQKAGETPERTSVPTTAQSQVPSYASATSQKVVTSQGGHVLDATESDPNEANLISWTDVGKWVPTESHTEVIGSALVVKSPQCLLVDTDLPFCSSMVGEQIAVPNYLNHSTLAEVQELLNDWAWLLKSRCHHSLEWFFCLLLVPKCGSMEPRPVLPCRSFCEVLRDSCWTLLDEGRLPVECHILPDEEDDGYQCLSVSNQKGNHLFKLILVCGLILNQFSISLLPSLYGVTPTTQYPPQK